VSTEVQNGQQAHISPSNKNHKELWEFIEKRLSSELLEKWRVLKTEKALRTFVREFVKSDFASLVFMLGYRDLGAFHLEPIQALSQNRFITDDPVRNLWLWCRGFFKTSIINECHSIYLIINNENIRILLPSFTISISEDILRNIKNKFITNELFRYYFSDFCPKPNSAGKIEFGTTEDFTVPCRTRSLKEPTMMCSGVGTNLTGLHFDYMKIDDLVTKDSVTNDSQIQASKDYYASLRHLFDKVAVPREDVIGTIYHFNDLYSAILRKMASKGEFKESFIPARINGVAIFPERLPNVEIDKLINDPSIGPYQVQTQYFLNPVNPADAKFKEEWLKYYGTEAEPLPQGLVEYILVDPASTTKKKSDYTVIERWGVDYRGKTYLLEGVRDKVTSFQRIDLLFEFVSHSKNLKEVKYEVIGGRHGDLEVIEQRQKEKRIHFKVVETKGTTHSKADRIEQRLVGQYHAGCVLLPQELYFISKYDGKAHNFVQQLKLEYLQFPFTEHDDILDTQAQLFEEKVSRGTKTVVEQRKEGVTADQWDKMYKEIDKWKEMYPKLDNQALLHKIYSRKLGSHIRFNQMRGK
jgi:phage terminase large subunit-like protein